MGQLFVIDHPFVQDKISMIRDERTGNKEFRELVEELASLISETACVSWDICVFPFSAFALIDCESFAASSAIFAFCFVLSDISCIDAESCCTEDACSVEPCANA